MLFRVVIAAGDALHATPIQRAVGDAFGHAEQAQVHARDTWTRTLEGPPADLVIAAWPLGWVDDQEFSRALPRSLARRPRHRGHRRQHRIPC